VKLSLRLQTGTDKPLPWLIFSVRAGNHDAELVQDLTPLKITGEKYDSWLRAKEESAATAANRSSSWCAIVVPNSAPSGCQRAPDNCSDIVLSPRAEVLSCKARQLLLGAATAPTPQTLLWALRVGSAPGAGAMNEFCSPKRSMGAGDGRI